MSLPLPDSKLWLALCSLAMLAPAGPAQDLFATTASNRLLGIRSSAPGRIATNVAITGLAPNEALLGIDFRPATGELYGLGATSVLYKLDVRTGVATPVGAPFAPALNGTQFGFDFNPTVDRIRIVSDADQNLRVHPDTGAVAAVDTTLAFASGDRFRGLNPNAVACAYTNSFPGATATQLFAIDSNLDALLLQDPPNGGVLNTVGVLGLNTSATLAFDIGGATGEAWAALTSPGAGASSLVRIDRASGAAQFVATIAVAETITGLSIVPPGAAPYFGGQEIHLATETGRLLVVDSAAPGVIQRDLPISGLAAGERVLGIDFRPATGELYVLGSGSQIYVIDPSNGQASAIGAAFTPALAGNEFGFDFNPTVDRIRIASDTGQNLRAHPTTGAIVATDVPLNYDAADPNAGAAPDLIASSYTNSVPLATSTVLYGIDRRRDALVVQDPPNAGVLSTVGALGFDVAGSGALDVIGTTGTAYAVLSSSSSGTPSLFFIDLARGRAGFIATLPTSDRIAGMSVRPVYGTVQFGAASNGCPGLPGIGASDTPLVGNLAFEIRGSNAPALTQGPLSLGLVRSVPPIRILDVLFHVSPFDASTIWAPAFSDANGFASVGVPIPGDPQLRGLELCAQFFWIDRCSIAGLSATHGLAIAIR